MPQPSPIRPQDASDYGSSFEPLLDSDEAAALLKVHPKTLQRMARNREVPAIQIGKLWRFRASDLAEWADHLAKLSNRKDSENPTRRV